MCELTDFCIQPCAQAVREDFSCEKYMYLDMFATVEDNHISIQLPACYALVSVQYRDIEREREMVILIIIIDYVSLQSSTGGVLEILNYLWSIAAGQGSENAH